MTFRKNESTGEITRRIVVVGGGSVVVGLGLFTAACGSSSGTAATSAPAPATGAEPPPSVGGSAPTAAGGQRVPLGKASALPIGGGVVYAAEKVVVTQPQAGTYVGLSAICTHMGCTVRDVSGGTINCLCHGSRYHLDGTVARGPAPGPLPPRPVIVVGGELQLG